MVKIGHGTTQDVHVFRLFHVQSTPLSCLIFVKFVLPMFSSLVLVAFHRLRDMSKTTKSRLEKQGKHKSCRKCVLDHGGDRPSYLHFSNTIIG
jgi:hypothetical protein